MENTETNTQWERQLAVALQNEPETWTQDCLEPERMLALAEHSLPEAEAAPLMAHVALCARCRREYAETVELMQLSEEVRALEAQAEPSPEPPAPPVHTPQPQSDRQVLVAPKPSLWERRQRWFSPGLGFTLGAAAAGVALFFALTVPARTQRDRLAATLAARNAEIARAEQAKTEAQQQLAALQQQSQGNTGRLAREVDRLKTQVKQQGIQVARLTEAETTLQQMPLPAPDWMPSRQGSVMRGGGGTETQAPEITPVQPVNTAIAETTPILEVRPVSGATHYQISLESPDPNVEIPAPKPLSATRWQAAAPLQPGKVYQWAVTAQRGDKSLRSPLVKFYVLSPAEKQEIEAARRRYAHSPLTLGTIYARLGMTAEAEQQFRAGVNSGQDASVAQRWLQELEAQRRQP